MISAGAVTIAALIILYLINGIAPFGNSTLVSNDAYYQYMDFFAYLKNVIGGRDNIAYTFSKGLGGDGIALFTYYLTSPFNLLLFLFKTSELHSFFNLSVMLKLTAASVTFAYFAAERFRDALKGRIVLYVLLSVGYGLSQYSIAQSNNIMWLDGVYMMPLIMLQVYRLIHGGSGWRLTAAVGLAIVFNWYTAGIICIYTGVYFLLEAALAVSDKWADSADMLLPAGGGQKAETVTQQADADRQLQAGQNRPAAGLRHNAVTQDRPRAGSKNHAVRGSLRVLLNYICSMLLGTMLGACILLPSAAALSNSQKGSLNLSLLFDMTFAGNAASVLQRYCYGAVSEYGAVALFCGGLALVLALSFVFNGQFSIAKRAVLGALLVFSLIVYFWNPLFVTFSLFRKADSFYYRYSFITIFSLLYLAACGAAGIESLKRLRAVIIAGLAVILGLLFFKLMQANASGPELTLTGFKLNGFTITGLSGTLVMMALLLILYLAYTYAVLRGRSRHLCCGLALLLLTVGTADLMLNADALIKEYSLNNVDRFKEYKRQQSALIEEVKALDSGVYRVSQTSTYGGEGLTANYNESLAYTYKGVGGYTSSPDANQLMLLNSLGYKLNGETFNITNESVLAADSLLGVKYILSSKPVDGLEPVQASGDGKCVYRNPYALPLAFTTAAEELYSIEYYENPFEYTNFLYKMIFGSEEDVYTEADYTAEFNDARERFCFMLRTSGASDKLLYGNINGISEECNTKVYSGDTFITDYACWCSPSVFYIPTGDNAYDSHGTETAVRIETDAGNALDELEVQFYALNLETLRKYADTAYSNKADELELGNGHVSAIVHNRHEGEHLFLSVPVDKGWAIYRNGELLSRVDRVGGCFYCIPLTDGENHIEMKYHAPGLREGIAISIAGLLLTVAVNVRRKKRHP